LDKYLHEKWKVEQAETKRAEEKEANLLATIINSFTGLLPF
jgi:hypothetical protein